MKYLFVFLFIVACEDKSEQLAEYEQTVKCKELEDCYTAANRACAGPYTTRQITTSFDADLGGPKDDQTLSFICGATK